LSIGYVSAVAGVGLAILLQPPTVIGWPVALIAALLIAALIGILHGWIITFFQVPSFVVTLAGLLAWNGVVLIIIGEGGTVIIQDATINGIANSFLPPALGWLVAVVGVAGYAATQILRRQTRQATKLSVAPMSILIIQVVFLAIIAFFVVTVANQDRGVPFVGVLILVLLVGLTYLAENTRFGRYVYAIGGNKEAARRAGIKVEQVRTLVFMISSLMAGVGGIIVAGRLRSVATNSGGGNLLLNCIASAVIGGASLFGGQGRVFNAVLGALIVASVENGMGLLGLSSGIQFIITGLVLLSAVLVDAISRRSQQQSGRR
jgi:D-xylose transport system permease protein